MCVVVEREEHVEICKQRYRDQVRGKENHLFNSILDKSRTGSGGFGSSFFLLMRFFRMGESVAKGRSHKRTRM